MRKIILILICLASIEDRQQSALFSHVSIREGVEKLTLTVSSTTVTTVTTVSTTVVQLYLPLLTVTYISRALNICSSNYRSARLPKWLRLAALCARDWIQSSLGFGSKKCGKWVVDVYYRFPNTVRRPRSPCNHQPRARRRHNCLFWFYYLVGSARELSYQPVLLWPRSDERLLSLIYGSIASLLGKLAERKKMDYFVVVVVGYGAWWYLELAPVWGFFYCQPYA